MTEIQRKLASVRRIEAIDPIEGADNIVCATVDGWQLVTQKSNNFQPGDLVVYFEIDSFLPICEKFEFLRKSSYKKMGEEEGFRLKTIKLRGQVSQGLILPMSEFFDQDEDGNWIQVDFGTSEKNTLENGDVVLDIPFTEYILEEGDDLTEYLGVKKWDPPLPAALAGKARGNFPSFIPKTDQERAQNIFNKYLKNDNENLYEVTLKLDGSSCTVYHNEGRTGVCSRNLDLEETEDNTFWRVARASGLVDYLDNLGRNIAVQAELMGPGVQGNREGLKHHQLYVFDVYDIDERRYLNNYERIKLGVDIQGKMNMNDRDSRVLHTPVIAIRNLSEFDTMDKLLAYADRASVNHAIAEGIVFKREGGDRFSFKVINNKFLLKEKD